MRRHQIDGKLTMKSDPYETVNSKVKDTRVTFDDWEHINEYEINEGKKIGMCRVKLDDHDQIRKLL